MFRRALFALLQLGSTACATTVCTKGPCGPGNGAWATHSLFFLPEPNIARGQLPPPHCTLRRRCLHRKVRRHEASAVRVPPERRDLCDQRPQRPILRRGKSLYRQQSQQAVARSHAPAHRSAQVHGMYHNFYQDHLAEPQAEMGPGRGPDWGHWISRDFLHWARLPVAIWNDQWYRQQDLLLLRWYAAIH